MKYKAFFSLLVASILLISSAAAPLAKVNASYSIKTSSDYFYSRLKTDKERDFYDRLLETCNKIDDDSENSYASTPYVSPDGLTSAQAEETAWIFFIQQPEFFWLSSEIKTSSLRGLCFEVLPEFQSGSDRADAKKKIIQEENKYISGAKKYTTQYEKARYIHDQLVNNISYNKNSIDQSIASVFLEKETVCAGFSKAYALLCNAVGIETITAAGFVHNWNIINIDSVWYIVDVTNDYASSNKHKLFLIDDNSLKKIDDNDEDIYTYHKNNQTIEFKLHTKDNIHFPVYYNIYPECSNTSRGMSLNLTDMGDVNFDKTVDSKDATLILAEYAFYLLGSTYSVSDVIADVNNDNKIDSRDATVILGYYAKKLLEPNTGSMSDYLKRS